MSCLRVLPAGCAVAMLMTANAFAADMPGSYPPPVSTRGQPANAWPNFNGWYLRGDLGYRWGTVGSATSVGGPANPTDSKLGKAGTASAGVGVKSGWLRTDFTVDYAFPANYRGTVLTADDVTAKIQSTTLFLNTYIDLGTWRHLTPYIGAGAGAANVRVTDYQSAVAPPFTGTSHSEWKFALAGMAGLAYAISNNVQIDLGYRYVNYGNVKSGTDSFGSMTFKNVAGHEVRVGLRWNFDDLYTIR